MQTGAQLHSFAAEKVALTDATKMACWIKDLAMDLGAPVKGLKDVPCQLRWSRLEYLPDPFDELPEYGQHGLAHVLAGYVHLPGDARKGISAFDHRCRRWISPLGGAQLELQGFGCAFPDDDAVGLLDHVCDGCVEVISR